MSKNTKKSIKVAVLAVFVGVFAFSLAYAVASSITAKNIIKLVNEARTGAGLKVLEENSQLTAAAEKKAEDMIKNDYFAHNSPDGKTPWYWMEKAGYDYKYAGENLAMNFSSAEEEQKAWMKSQTHRKNILSSNYQEIGVAVKEGKIDGKETMVAVQMFGSRLSFIPAEKVPAQNNNEVLGEEKKTLAEPDTLIFPDKVGIPEVVPNNGNMSQEASSLWISWKNKIANTPWATSLALNILWTILVGNLLFLFYAFGRKMTPAGNNKEEQAKERKIPVKNLEGSEKNISVAVKVHILRAAG